MKPEQLRTAGKQIEAFLRVVSRQARKRGVDLWDLRQAGLLAAVIANRNYDPSKAEWITHLYQPVRFAIFRELLKLSLPVRAGRDEYKLGLEIKPLEISETTLKRAAYLPDVLRQMEAQALLEEMEALYGAEGAKILASLLLGLMTLKEAADVAELSVEDLRVFRDHALNELRRKHGPHND